MSKLLEIRDLRANIGDKEILKGFTLSVDKGEVHAIMGPNGSGKSTLANVLMGNPHYVVTGGEVLFKGQPLTELAPDERARLYCESTGTDDVCPRNLSAQGMKCFQFGPSVWPPSCCRHAS